MAATPPFLRQLFQHMVQSQGTGLVVRVDIRSQILFLCQSNRVSMVSWLVPGLETWRRAGDCLFRCHEPLAISRDMDGNRFTDFRAADSQPVEFKDWDVAPGQQPLGMSSCN